MNKPIYLLTFVAALSSGVVSVSGCRLGSECVFYQQGKGKFDFKPAAVPAPGK